MHHNFPYAFNFKYFMKRTHLQYDLINLETISWKTVYNSSRWQEEKEQQNPVLNITQFDKEPAAIISSVNIQNVL